MHDWNQRRVLVTGASAGLGWQIARAFLINGARVAIVGRNVEKLEAAADRLRSEESTGEVLATPGDVTSDEDVACIADEIKSHWGGLDVLVNNVGVSARGKLQDLVADDFTKSLEVNLLSVVRMTGATLPMLIESKGHIVNIGSLAARTAAPFLGPYTTSKHALAGYTHQLRLEVGPQGVHVLLVCPGPIARDDAGERYADQAADLPEAAAKPGGGVKLKGLDPARLARQILVACAHRKLELIVPFRVRLLMAVSALWPSLGDWIIRKMTGGK